MMELLKVGEDFTAEQRDLLQKKIDSLEVLETLPEGVSVSFYQTSITQARFKELFTNPILKKNGEVLVCKKSAIFTWNGKERWKIMTPRLLLTSFNVETLNEWIRFYNRFENTKKVVFEETLILQQAGEHGRMTHEVYESLKEMISSKDPEAFRLGHQLMFMYDYDESKDYMVLLLLRLSSIPNQNSKAEGIIKRKMKQDYPQLRNLKYL